MLAWFKKQSPIVQFVLLILPFVGWICELVIRWEFFLKNGGVMNLVIALIYTFVGWAWVLGLIDAILVLLDKGMLFIDYGK